MREGRRQTPELETVRSSHVSLHFTEARDARSDVSAWRSTRRSHRCPSSATDYLTEGADPGRTGWMKDEKCLHLENVKDTRLLWKVKLDSQPRQMHNLFPPLIAERVTTPRGTREMAIVAGVSDDLFGIDVASGEVVWKKRYASTYAPSPNARVSHAVSGRTDGQSGDGNRSHRANTRSMRSDGTAGCNRSTPPTDRTSRRPRRSCRRTASRTR